VPPEDKDPIQLLAPTRKSIALFGAVNLGTGQLLFQLEEKFNAMTFQSFLEKMLSHRLSDRRLVGILDNAKYHHAKLLKPFLRRHRKQLKLEFLPAYSPELNPIERVSGNLPDGCAPIIAIFPNSLTCWMQFPVSWHCGKNQTIHYENYAALYDTSCIVSCPSRRRP